MNNRFNTITRFFTIAMVLCLGHDLSAQKTYSYLRDPGFVVEFSHPVFNADPGYKKSSILPEWLAYESTGVYKADRKKNGSKINSIVGIDYKMIFQVEDPDLDYSARTYHWSPGRGYAEQNRVGVVILPEAATNKDVVLELGAVRLGNLNYRVQCLRSEVCEKDGLAYKNKYYVTCDSIVEGNVRFVHQFICATKDEWQVVRQELENGAPLVLKITPVTTSGTTMRPVIPEHEKFRKKLIRFQKKKISRLRLKVYKNLTRKMIRNTRNEVLARETGNIDAVLDPAYAYADKYHLDYDRYVKFNLEWLKREVPKNELYTFFIDTVAVGSMDTITKLSYLTYVFYYNRNSVTAYFKYINSDFIDNYGMNKLYVAEVADDCAISTDSTITFLYVDKRKDRILFDYIDTNGQRLFVYARPQRDGSVRQTRLVLDDLDFRANEATVLGDVLVMKDELVAYYFKINEDTAHAEILTMMSGAEWLNSGIQAWCADVMFNTPEGYIVPNDWTVNGEKRRLFTSNHDYQYLIDKPYYYNALGSSYLSHYADEVAKLKPEQVMYNFHLKKYDMDLDGKPEFVRFAVCNGAILEPFVMKEVDGHMKVLSVQESEALIRANAEFRNLLTYSMISGR